MVKIICDVCYSSYVQYMKLFCSKNAQVDIQGAEDYRNLNKNIVQKLWDQEQEKRIIYMNRKE